MNAGNWGAFLQGGIQGAQTEQSMESRNLQNQYEKNAFVDPALRENNDQTQWNRQLEQDAGRTAAPAASGLFDPVRNKLADVYQSAKAKIQSWLPGQGQHSSGPSSQPTVNQQTNVAQSAPQPTSSSPSAGGLPGPGGPGAIPYANGGGIPRRGPVMGRGRSGVLRQRKAPPGNLAKPTKAAQSAMHPPLEKAPVDNQEMGAEGGPPGNTDPSPSDQDPMLADGGHFIQGAIKRPGALHAQLGVPQGEKIPKAKLDAAAKSKGKLGQRARFAETLSKFANGGVIPKQDQFKLPPAPKPQPNMIQREIGEDGQRNRLSRTIKRFADGGSSSQQDPPETNAQHLAKLGAGALGVVASSPVDDMFGIQNPGNISPFGAVADAGKAAYGAVKDWLGRPWDTPDAPAQGNTPSAPGTAPKPGANQNAALAEGPPAPQGGAPAAAPASSPVASRRQGPPKSAPTQAPNAADTAPIDFSQLRIDHTQIPTTTAAEWDQQKKSLAASLNARGMPGPQAMLEADNQISDFQHKQFMQYVQQGIALDAAGDKQGAMAALKTGYQYMPTGHDVQFGLDPRTNTIVGMGVDENTGQPVGKTVVLDQQGLNRMLATYQDPKNFVNESLALREQALREKMAPAQNALIKAQTYETNQRGNFYGDANATKLAQVMIRNGGRGALPQDQWAKVNSALAQKIMDPNLQSQATGVATYLMQHGHPPGDAVAIAGMMYTAPADRRIAYAQQYQIPIPELEMSTNPMLLYGAGYGSGGYGGFQQ